MRLFPKKMPKRSKSKSNKKVVLGTLKSGSKWLGAGLLMGAGAEIAGHISSKAQQVDNGAQYVTITDWGPSLIRSDSEASSDGSQRWLFGSRNPLTFGIPTFLIAIMIVISANSAGEDSSVSVDSSGAVQLLRIKTTPNTPPLPLTLRLLTWRP